MKRIDLGPVGRSGIEARIWRSERGVNCYIPGTDHWDDILHHVRPGAERREAAAAKAIACELLKYDADCHIAGQSLGATIAVIAAHLIGPRATAYVYGGKRAPRRYTEGVRIFAYRHRGDLVPALPPWRPRYENWLIGDWKPVWKAHQPRSYYDVMRLDGFR